MYNKYSRLTEIHRQQQTTKGRWHIVSSGQCAFERWFGEAYDTRFLGGIFQEEYVYHQPTM
jgi:hypothetical protein